MATARLGRWEDLVKNLIATRTAHSEALTQARVVASSTRLSSYIGGWEDLLSIVARNPAPLSDAGAHSEAEALSPPLYSWSYEFRHRHALVALNVRVILTFTQYSNTKVHRTLKIYSLYRPRLGGPAGAPTLKPAPLLVKPS